MGNPAPTPVCAALGRAARGRRPPPARWVRAVAAEAPGRGGVRFWGGAPRGAAGGGAGPPGARALVPPLPLRGVMPGVGGRRPLVVGGPRRGGGGGGGGGVGGGPRHWFGVAGRRRAAAYGLV